LLARDLRAAGKFSLFIAWTLFALTRSTASALNAARLPKWADSPQRSRSGEREHSDRRLLNVQTHPHRVQTRTNTKRRTSMGTCIRKVVTASAAILALTLLLPG